MRNKSQDSVSINAQSMGADITGIGCEMKGAGGFFMAAEWSGSSPVGVLYLQHRLRSTDNWLNLLSWNIDGDGSETLDYTNFRGNEVRAFFDRTSGTGTMSVVFNRKE